VTEEELTQAVEAYNARVAKLNRQIDRVNRIEHELYLVAAVVYLSGIVFGVVMAKRVFGL